MVEVTLLAQTFVELADSLVDDFDVVDFLTLVVDRCVDVLDVTAAGLMLASPGGDLRVMASSSEQVHLLELYQLQAQEGPCLDCFRSGEPVAEVDLTNASRRWPRFSSEAVHAGFRGVYAHPLRLRGNIAGALNLFTTTPHPIDDEGRATAQALADVATIAVLSHRAAREAQRLNEQLTLALNTRVVVEQAKGMIAERLGLNMEDAFQAIRTHARGHNQHLADVAQAIIDQQLKPSDLNRK
jgi:GAF domain-containing protein